MKMKKVIIFLLWICATSLVAKADNVLHVAEIKVEKEQKGGFSHAWVHFPTDDDSPVRRAIIDFIFQCMHSFSNADIDYPSNTCDEKTFKDFLDNYTDSLCLFCAIDQQEYAAFCAESGEVYEVPWFRNFSIQKVSETERYVSYACYDGEFCGGAHDNRGSVAKTFRKSDGAAIDIFEEDEEEDEDVTDRMQDILWKYLALSVEAVDSKEYSKQIGDFLEANYGNRERLCLPGGSIFLAPDGVHLEYQPLVISFWAMGEPIIVIPYEAAKPFLTAEAARLAGLIK